jgi:hypothetical protein
MTHSYLCLPLSTHTACLAPKQQTPRCYAPRPLPGGWHRLTVLSGRYILMSGTLNERSHMQPEHHTNMHAAALGSLGGLKRRERLSSEERRAIARHAARSRWHPREAQEIRERAQEITNLVKQALKDSKQLPLV